MGWPLRRVPKQLLRSGHAVWISPSGDAVDLGPLTLEDARLLAFVAQEAARRPWRASRATGRALDRSRALAERWYDRLKDHADAEATRSVKRDAAGDTE